MPSVLHNGGVRQRPKPGARDLMTSQDLVSPRSPPKDVLAEVLEVNLPSDLTPYLKA